MKNTMYIWYRREGESKELSNNIVRKVISFSFKTNKSFRANIERLEFDKFNPRQFQSARTFSRTKFWKQIFTFLPSSVNKKVEYAENAAFILRIFLNK